jgi:hypothetical protein
MQLAARGAAYGRTRFGVVSMVADYEAVYQSLAGPLIVIAICFVCRAGDLLNGASRGLIQTTWEPVSEYAPDLNGPATPVPGGEYPEPLAAFSPFSLVPRTLKRSRCSASALPGSAS